MNDFQICLDIQISFGTASKPNRRLTGSSIRFRTVAIVLNATGRNRRLSFEAAPYRMIGKLMGGEVNFLGRRA